MSDWGATHDSAADNANAGLDMEQPGDSIFIGELWTWSTPTCRGLTNFAGGGVFGDGNLKSAVESGKVTVARLNEMVARVLAPWYRLGQDSVSVKCISTL